MYMYMTLYMSTPERRCATPTLVMMANKPETALYRVAHFSLGSHTLLLSCTCCKYIPVYVHAVYMYMYDVYSHPVFTCST